MCHLCGLHCSRCIGGYGLNTGNIDFSCDLCPKNTYAPHNGTSCLYCPDNTETMDNIVPKTSIKDCIPCQNGYSVSGSSCIPICPAGQYLEYGACKQCTIGYYSIVNSTICKLCPLGYVPNADSTGCISCPAGTYGAGGNTRCVECPIGKYSPSGTNALSCYDCPEGHYS